MSLAGNAAAAYAAASVVTAATAATDKTKMCTSSLIFRATKWCFSLAKIFHKYLPNNAFLGGLQSCRPENNKLSYKSPYGR